MKNLKKALMLIFAAALLFCLAACAEEGDNSLTSVIDAKKIVIGMDDSLTPVCYRDENSELRGIAPKIAQEFAASLGARAEIRIVDTDEAVSALDKGIIDCYIGYPNLDYQTGLLVESMEMQFECNYIVIVPSDSDAKKLYDLSGETVVVVANTDAAAVLTNTTEFRTSLKDVVSFRTEKEALDALDSGKAQGAAFEEAFILWVLKNEPDKYQIIDQKLQSGDYYILFKKDAKQLSSRIGQLYALLSDRGQLDSIFSSEMSETDIEAPEGPLLTQSESDLIYGDGKPKVSPTDITAPSDKKEPVTSATDTSATDTASKTDTAG